MATIDLPSNPYFSLIDLEPDHLVSVSEYRGGYTSEITNGDPIWGGVLSTVELSERELRAWEAFIAEATERKLPFDFIHPTKRTPSAYSMTSLPFDGTSEVEDLSDLNEPHLSGLTVGLVLRRGDRVAFVEDDYVSHRMVRSDLVVASAVNQAVPITPRLPLGRFTTAAEAIWKEPPMRLRVRPNTWRAPLRPAERPIGTFEVYEAPR